VNKGPAHKKAGGCLDERKVARRVRANGLNQSPRRFTNSAGDEWLQSMVPGRTGSLMDVLSDAAGAGFAAFLCFLWSTKPAAGKR